MSTVIKAIYSGLQQYAAKTAYNATILNGILTLPTVEVRMLQLSSNATNPQCTCQGLTTDQSCASSEADAYSIGPREVAGGYIMKDFTPSLGMHLSHVSWQQNHQNIDSKHHGEGAAFIPCG